jgi:hypothetical protein
MRSIVLVILPCFAAAAKYGPTHHAAWVTALSHADAAVGDGDGKVSAEEWARLVDHSQRLASRLVDDISAPSYLRRVDTDGDNRVSRVELAAALHNAPPPPRGSPAERRQQQQEKKPSEEEANAAIDARADEILQAHDADGDGTLYGGEVVSFLREGVKAAHDELRRSDRVRAVAAVTGAHRHDQGHDGAKSNPAAHDRFLGLLGDVGFEMNDLAALASTHARLAEKYKDEL